MKLIHLIFLFIIWNIVEGKGDKSTCNLNGSPCTLQKAIAIYTNGESAPPLPNPDTGGSLYKFVSGNWPLGSNQLTTIGMKEAFGAGKYLRKRYQTLLIRGTDSTYPFIYSPDNVHILSLDKDACVSSGWAMAAGLYPQPKNLSWDPTVAWLPVPVYTTGKGGDLRAAPKNVALQTLGGGMNCPKFVANVQDRLTKSGSAKAWITAHAQLIGHLVKGGVIGEAESTPILLSNLYEFAERVSKDREKNLKSIPQEAMLSDGDLKTLAGLRTTWFNWVYGAINNSSKSGIDPNYEMVYLASGKILEKLASLIDAKAAEANKKLYLYSADAYTMAATRAALGIFHGKIPSSGSLLMLEVVAGAGQTTKLKVRVKIKEQSSSARDIPIPGPLCGRGGTDGACDAKQLLTELDKILKSGKRLPSPAHVFECDL